MKHCPTCKRTYTDESINFCLADGSFLSAPDDPQITTPGPAPRPSDAPTEILPEIELPRRERKASRRRTDSAPTLTSLDATPTATPNRLPWVVGLVVVGAIAVIAALVSYRKEASTTPGVNSGSATANANGGTTQTPAPANTNLSPEEVTSDRSNSNTEVAANNKQVPVQLPPVKNVELDPSLNKNLPYDRYGDPRSESTETPSGPGRGGGIGSGESQDNVTDNVEQPVDYNRVFTPREVSQKARILSKPEPQYTSEAKKNQISGAVVLRAVFSSSGEVTNIRVVSGLPYGLNERAIAAARMIRFQPALKDGRAVSQYMQIEYNFNLY